MLKNTKASVGGYLLKNTEAINYSFGFPPILRSFLLQLDDIVVRFGKILFQSNGNIL